MTFRIIFGLPQSFACLLLYVTFFDSIYSIIYLLIQFFINYEEKIFTRYILIMSWLWRLVLILGIFIFTS